MTSYHGGPFHGHTEDDDAPMTRIVHVTTVNTAVSRHDNLPADLRRGCYTPVPADGGWTRMEWRDLP